MQIATLLKILACPKCQGDLQLIGSSEAPEGFLCTQCALLYPIEDDIPIMLESSAQPYNKPKSKVETCES
ncbi:MAG: glycine cleavage system protein H [Desulfovibrionaceae bacterium]|nr:glycine cleavage system protein H [Desulfovibrionaceae bacterium]